MNGLVIHSILEFPFCLIKSTGSTFGYLTGERRLPDNPLDFKSHSNKEQKMILGLLIIALLVYLTRKMWINPDRSLDKEMAFFVLLGSTVLAIPVLVFASISLPAIDVPNPNVKLETLNLGDPSLHGRFFIGTGYIDTDQYYIYRYYVGDSIRDGRVIRFHDAQYLVSLIQDQGVESGAYLVTYHKEFAQSWFKYIALFPNDTGTAKYDFHIPAGSIVPEISIQN